MVIHFAAIHDVHPCLHTHGRVAFHGTCMAAGAYLLYITGRTHVCQYVTPAPAHVARLGPLPHTASGCSTPLLPRPTPLLLPSHPHVRPPPPQIECCIRCLSQGVTAAHIIDGRAKHSILMELLTDEGVGTMITG